MDGWKCHVCNGSMTVVENAQKHTYECAKENCRARAVIVPKGGDDPNAVFRWNLPAPPVFPSTEVEASPHPKDEASSAQRSGRGERIASGPFGAARAMADLFRGKTPIEIVNAAMPKGVKIVEHEGKLSVSDERATEASASIRRESDGQARDVYE